MRLIAVMVLAFAMGSSACSNVASAPGHPLSPSASPPSPPATPLPPPQPAPSGPVVFTDGASGFSTADVRDVHDQIVRFSTADELVWTIDDTRFPEFIADGNFIAYHHREDRFFQVRFGTMNGDRRAYLTRTDEQVSGAVPTLLDLWVDDHGDLKIADTSAPVPSS